MKKRYLKHFVRYDGRGKLIPGSNIRAPKTPRVGTWVEVNDNECCNPTTTTSTTIIEEWPEGETCYMVTLRCDTRGESATFGVYYCEGDPEGLVVDYYSPQEICCYQFPVVLLGNGSYTLGEKCVAPTTTTTTISPTTTTTTTIGETTTTTTTIEVTTTTTTTIPG